MRDKEAQKIRARRWYLANREKALARAKQQREADHEGYLKYLKDRYASIDPAVRKATAAEYHAKNRERDLARMKAYGEANKEGAKERDAKKYQERKEIILSQQATKYAENPQIKKDRARLWREANPEARGAISRNYKARKKSATGTHTAEDIARIVRSQGYKCVFCKTSVKTRRHVDHIMPLKLGGSNAPENLQILCASCNTRKGGKDPVEFAQRMGLLI